MRNILVRAIGLGLLILPIADLSPVSAASPEHYQRRDAERIRTHRPADLSNAINIDGTPPVEVERFPSPTRYSRQRESRGSGGISLVPGQDGPSRSLMTDTDDAGMAFPVGGDDVRIGYFSDVTGCLVGLQTSSDGRLFAAIQTFDVGISESRLRVYVSSDGGENWTLWSLFSLPDYDSPISGAFTVAEGVTTRALYAYGCHPGGNFTGVNLAYADINAMPPVWTVVNAMPGFTTPVDVTDIDIETDVANYTYYYVYVIATRGNPLTPEFDNDLWFAKSSDMGSSFEPAYKIADAGSLPEDKATDASIAYGEDDWLHVCYRGWASVGVDQGAFYRRAANVASAGISDWQPRVTLSPTDDGVAGWTVGLDAATNGSKVLVAYWLPQATYPDPDYYRATIRYSSDHGATWPPGDSVLADVGVNVHEPIEIAVNGDIVMTGQVAPPTDTVNVQITRADTSDVTSWSGAQAFTSFYDASTNGFSNPVVVDTSRAFQSAMAWVEYKAPGYSVLFDAEWRREPGYANTEAGFPIPVAGGGSTPPAIAEIDGDPFGEIVFGTMSGDIHVINHDGTEVPGWPQNIGGMPYDAPVAVGDLTGNGEPYIVAGSNGGEVWAFDAEGNVRPGWPVSMSTQNPVFVSIGALGPPNARYVVALCDKQMQVLRYDGVNVQTGPGLFTDGFDRPAAIGDVDDDGIGEIVLAHGPWIHVMSKNSSTAEMYRNFPGETFSDAATLCDLDFDGDLEIAAPTIAGKMYLMHHNGTDVTGWPVTVPSGSALTAASLANFRSSGEPEIVFGERDLTGLMHMYYYDGTEAGGYPESFEVSVTYMPPIIAGADLTSTANILFGIATGKVYSFRNLSGSHIGFPRNVPGVVEETPAAGDIDNDGRNEIVILGVSFLTVLDVGQPPQPNANSHWRMYGHDAQRTGCLNCEEVLTSVENTPNAVVKAELTAFPNPFNPVATISYGVERAGPVTMRVYDVAGRRVETLMKEKLHGAGRYSLQYEAKLPSGVYFLRMESAGTVLTSKLVLLK